MIEGNSSKDQYDQKPKELVLLYPKDLNLNLGDELKQFHHYMRAKIRNNENIKFTYSECYNIIVADNIQFVFPNVETALRIFLTLMITNCSAERSFSQLKRMKNPLRTTMNQDRLDSLALLCIESDILRRIHFDDIIKDFVAQKCRQQLF